MAKNRKNSQASSSSSGTAPTSNPPQTKPLVEIPEDEQWRLIQESGVLNKVSDLRPANDPRKVSPKTAPSAIEEEGPLSPLEEEVFRAVTLIIPFSFLLLLMNMWVHLLFG